MKQTLTFIGVLICTSILPTVLFADYFPDNDGDGYGDIWAVPDPNQCGGCVDNNYDCDDDDANNVVCLELPSTVYTTATGTFEIFFKNLILVDSITLFDFVINGTTYPGSDLSWTGTASSVNIDVELSGAVLASGSFNVEYNDYVTAANCSPSVVMTGHSYIQSGIELSHLVPTTPGLAYKGSQTAWTGDDHEAYGGWLWSDLIGTSSPYHDGNDLNISNYITSVLGGTAPDYWVIQMDVNDIISNTLLTTYAQINDHINNVIYPDALTFVNALTATTPDAKIAYMISPTPASPPVGDLLYRKRQYRVAHLATTTFENLPNVTVLPLNFELDPDTEMDATIVHPTSDGYAKLARGIAGWLAYEESMKPACPPGCNNPVLDPIIVTDNSGTPADNAACHNGDLGLEAIVDSGGTPPFSFSWSADPAVNVTFVNNAVALTGANFQNTTDDAIIVDVSVIVTDDNDCKDTATVNITIAPDLAFSILKIENSGPVPNDGVVCFDDVVSLEPDGLPNGNLSYDWSTTETTPTITVNPPNTNSNTNYSVTVIDSYGCSNQGLAGVTGISEVTNAVSYKPACDPASDPDSVVVDVTGGVPPYQFVVNGAPFGIQSVPWTFPTFLPAGSDITVEVMETNGCEGPTQTLTLPANPGALDATTVIVNENCDDLGSVDLTVTGGTPPYTFSWSNGATTEDLNDVSASLYVVDITDAFGCEISQGALVQLDVNWTWYEDADGDGYGNPNVSINSCDPQPGYVLENDEDCDDNDPLEFPGQNWYLDMDGDLYSDGNMVTDCERPANHLAQSELTSLENDCNDNDPAINPGAQEICNLIDDDCDGLVDEGLENISWYYDGDGDGYGAGEPIIDCVSPGHDYILINGDCDDTNPNINPSATETCNGLDDDCDDFIDNGLPFFDWYSDGDSDGYGSGTPINACESPGSGHTTQGGDCDESDPNVNPGETEVACNGKDDDCNPNTPDQPDEDGDGYSCEGDCDDTDPNVNIGMTEIPCDGIDNDCDPLTADGPDEDGDGYSVCGGDCDDNDPFINPGEDEVCDGIDNDCDGTIDVNPVSGPIWHADADDDNYGDPNTSVIACAEPIGYTDNDLDCNDNDPTVNPDADEVCDGIDNDCDGTVDENPVNGPTWYADSDGDNFGDPNVTIVACSMPTDYTDNDLDCDDGNPNINPLADEVCNDLDDDCDGMIDEYAIDAPTWYEDSDGDGFGNVNMVLVECDQPTGYVDNLDDCDDTDPTINPNTVWFVDFDGDGFGNPNSSVTACDPGTGYVLNDEDCDDSIAAINPNATETCNGLDDNCDGSIDEGLSPDADGDGYTAIGSCSGTADDCDDADPNINPGMSEDPCNGIDDNCNGVVDEGGGLTTWYADWDGDGYGDPNISTTSCVPPANFVDNDDDCNDNAININPAATEVCDGFDNNCDGNIDDGFDEDGDGFKTCQGDCDDNDPAVNPGASEICDGLDNDCDGSVDEGFDNDNDGWRTCDGDCNDWNAAIYPGATETCNWKDDDCDGQIDEGVQVTYYLDWDNDGYGRSDISTNSCSPPNGFVANDDDCNDNAININPGATEICDGFDNDCDGLVDEGFDEDDDGYSTCQGDCDDNDAAINPGATEICDGIDNDCDSETDEGLSWDWDGDGYTAIGSCSGSADDCNDWNSNINPGALEVCNWQDDNCDGNVDEGIGDFWYLDDDDDGFGDPNDVVQSCWFQWGRVQNDEDCNDSDGSIHPNASEVCDGIDNDCDGIIDNVGGPDLIVLSASFPANVSPGQNITISGTIKNQGDQDVGTNRVYWWLSQDEFIDNGDYRLNSWKRSTNNIDAGETKDFSKNSTIPSSGWNGSNYLIFRADAEDHIAEGCENNNDSAYPIDISVNLVGNGNDDRAISFSAVKNGYEADLHWLVSFEQDVEGMTVERSSNGTEFIPLFEMPNAIVVTGENEVFTQTDRLPHAGDNYYRVQFHLADGTTTFTETKLVAFSELEPFDVIPNPASTFINVRMKRFTDKAVDVVLFDRFAREVYRLSVEKVENEWLMIDLHDVKFKDGLYVLSVIDKGRAISKRLVITKFE